MELFEQLRRDYEAWGNIRSVARKYQVHRRMVRQALADAQPPDRRKPQREQPKIAPVKEFIDQILTSGRNVWRKQRFSSTYGLRIQSETALEVAPA